MAGIPKTSSTRSAFVHTLRVVFASAAVFGGLTKAYSQSLKQFRSIDVIPDDGGTIEADDGAGKIRTARKADPESIGESETGEKKPPVFLTLKAGETLRTTKESQATVTLGDFGNLRLEPNTEIRLPVEEKDVSGGTSLKLLRGRVYAEIDGNEERSEHEFRLELPKLVIAVRGTRFFAATEKGRELAGVHEGAVVATLVREGQAKNAEISAGRFLTVDSDGNARIEKLGPEEMALQSKYQPPLVWRPSTHLQTIDWRREKAGAESGKSFEHDLGTGFEIPNMVVEPGKTDVLLFGYLDASKIDGELPTLAEFFVRGNSSASDDDRVSLVRIGPNSQAPRISVSQTEWTRVLVPIQPAPANPVDDYLIRLDGVGLDPGSEYWIQVIPGKILMRKAAD